jgi:hypothetical protein
MEIVVDGLEHQLRISLRAVSRKIEELACDPWLNQDLRSALSQLASDIEAAWDKFHKETEKRR